MAQFSHLPIYVKTYESIGLIYKIVGQFRKEYKHTLGAEIQEIAWKMLDEIILVNSQNNEDKKHGIQKISMLFDRLKIRFRFAYEIGLIPSKKFEIVQKQFEEIGKMIGGWMKWVEI